MQLELDADGVDNRRRALLAALAAGGTAGLAGCPDGDTPTVGTTPTDAATPTDTATPTERPPESLTFEGLEHAALGGASLDASEDRLVVSGIREDGGVRADFGSVGAASVSLDPLDLGGEGARFDVSGTGTVGGSAGQSIGTISLRNAGDTVEAVADYSDVGSDRVRVQVVEGGEVVGETVVEGGGTVATVEPGPDGLPQVEGCDKDILPDPPFPPIPCYVPVWDRLGTVVASDGTELGSGDRLRLLAAEPRASLEAIGGFDLAAAGVGEFALTGESTEPLEGDVVFEGLQHEALGDASLDVADDRLAVSGVDGQGDDGVRADFGSVDAASVSLDPVDLGGRGRRFDVSGTGAVDGTPGRSIGGISLRGTGETIEAVADYSDVGAELVRVRLVDRGKVVGETVVEGGGTVATVEPGPDGLPQVEGCDKDLPPDPPLPCYQPRWDRRAEVVASDGTELGSGDRLQLFAAESDSTLEAIETFDLTAAGVSEFSVMEESIGVFGNDHEAVGDATLGARNGGSELTVGNLGNARGNGVRASFGGVGHAAVRLDPVEIGADRRFEVRGTGTVGGATGQPIGSVSLRGTGDAVEAVVDYSDVGSERVRVEVAAGGEVVGSTVVPGGGAVATIFPPPEEPSPPPIDRGEKDLTVPGTPPCYIIGLDGAGTVRTPDDDALASGDEVRLLAAEPEASIESIESFELAGTGLGSMTITGEVPGVER